MCFRFCLSWISFIWIMHHNHMECFIFPNELWKCTNVQLNELWKCTNVQLYELCKWTNVQLYELCIMKFNEMKAKHSQGLIWRADRLNCQSDDQIHFKVVSLFYIYTNKKPRKYIHISLPDFILSKVKFSHINIAFKFEAAGRGFWHSHGWW